MGNVKRFCFQNVEFVLEVIIFLKICTRGYDIPQEANEYVVVAMAVMKHCFLDCCQRKKKKGIGKKGWSIV